MLTAKELRRWTAIAVLWTLFGAGFWLVSVQIFLAVLTPFGTWQWPKVARVQVLRYERDPDDHFLDWVYVLQDGRQRTLRMLKTERAQLTMDEQIWVLDNWYAFGSRPPHYRLTPARAALEFPEPLMALALWLILRIRRAQKREAQAEAEDPTRVRTVYRDDFHARAWRFDASRRGEEQGPPGQDGDPTPR